MRIRIYQSGFSFYTIRTRIQIPRIFSFHALTMNMKNFLTIFPKFAIAYTGKHLSNTSVFSLSKTYCKIPNEICKVISTYYFLKWEVEWALEHLTFHCFQINF